MEYTDKIKKLVNQNLSKYGNIFDNFINEFDFSLQTSHNMQELKQKYNKKHVGDLFEAFCYLYVKNILQHDVWFYKDFPLELKNELNLTKNDYGIDLVSKKDGKYNAIQCKYRKKKDKIQLVSWKSLSTFYALTAKSGPWNRHIVMTNLNGCRHIGKKDAKDLSICIKTFQNMTSFDWLQLIESSNTSLISYDENTVVINTKSLSLPIDELRKLRLKYYSKL